MGGRKGVAGLMLGALVLAALVALAGRGAGALADRSEHALRTLQRISRWLAAGFASLFGLVFGAGVVGAVINGDDNPELLVLGLALWACCGLLWRGADRHLAVAGHWLAAVWLLYSASRSGGSPFMAALFVAVALPALFAAGAEAAHPRQAGP